MGTRKLQDAFPESGEEGLFPKISHRLQVRYTAKQQRLADGVGIQEDVKKRRSNFATRQNPRHLQNKTFFSSAYYGGRGGAAIEAK